MTPEEFEKIVNSRLEKIKAVLLAKGKEYGSTDRLHNFKVAARKLDCSPAKALQGMEIKHDVSIDDMINGILPITEYYINEKIGDKINYYILLEAIFVEELQNITEKKDPSIPSNDLKPATYENLIEQKNKTIIPGMIDYNARTQFPMCIDCRHNNRCSIIPSDGICAGKSRKVDLRA